MITSKRIAPPNSVILIEDPSGGEIPASMNQSVIAATDSCIAVGCLAEDDGETEIILGLSGEVSDGDQPAFDGLVKTPSRKVAVRTVHGVTVLETAVPKSEARVQVWVNDTREPDRITVAVS